MFDSHCHLDSLPDPAAAAAEAPLTGLVTIGADPEHARAAVRLASELENVWAAVGLHPMDAAQDSPEVRSELEDLARAPKVVAIGETGLDYYWDAAPRQVQVAAFEWQLDLAARLDRPVIIHCRDKQNSAAAYEDTAAVLTAAGHRRGVLHCFPGHEGLLKAGLDLGFMVSFAGNVTFKNAMALQDAALKVPRDRLLVETDSPYLAPVPFRGKPNRPALAAHTIDFLAGLLGLPAPELARLTEANARRLYGLPPVTA
ncbi:MAG TPA: TatD family hydrolase [Deinococcales bacterium]|nr:TatD family hydrolase [Deinococcales bacterium]